MITKYPNRAIMNASDPACGMIFGYPKNYGMLTREPEVSSVDGESKDGGESHADEAEKDGD